MKQLDRLETLAQNLIEGIFDRLRRENNQPDTKKVLVINAHQAAKGWLLQFKDYQLPLGEPVINIGRALNNDIVLNDPTVSRYHAQLRWREGCYYLCPPAVKHNTSPASRTQKMKNRSNPWTTVNQQPVSQHRLAPDDIIALGKTTLAVIIK